MKFLVVLSIALVFFVGCQSGSTKSADSGVPSVAAEIKDVSPSEAQKAVSEAYSQFIDVRTPEEYAGGHAVRAQSMPLDVLTSNFDKLNRDEPVYIICQTGNRSKKAATILKEAGFKSVFNITGGTSAWASAGLPMETRPPHNVPPANSSKGGKL